MTMASVILSIVWIAAFTAWGYACFKVGEWHSRTVAYRRMVARMLRQRPQDPDPAPRSH